MWDGALQPPSDVHRHHHCQSRPRPPPAAHAPATPSSPLQSPRLRSIRRRACFTGRSPPFVSGVRGLWASGGRASVELPSGARSESTLNAYAYAAARQCKEKTKVSDGEASKHKNDEVTGGQRGQVHLDGAPTLDKLTS